MSTDANPNMRKASLHKAIHTSRELRSTVADLAGGKALEKQWIVEYLETFHLRQFDTNLCFVAIWKFDDEIMCVGYPRSFLNFFIGGIWACNFDIVFDAHGE